MPSRNAQLILNANEQLITAGNLAAIPDFFAKYYRAHAAGTTHQGHALIRRWLSCSPAHLSPLSAPHRGTSCL